MKNRDDKKKDFEELRKALEKANNVFITGFEKITVDQDYKLRKTIRGAGGNTRSSRTTLLRKRRRDAVRTGHEGSEGHDLDGLDAKILWRWRRRSRPMPRRIRRSRSRRDWWKAVRSISRRSTISPTMPSKEEIFAKLLDDDYAPYNTMSQ